MPSFMTDVLEQLGWSDGTFIPVANEENKALEALLEQSNRELIQLKAETDVQATKQNELERHRKNLFAEYQENMHLLVVHKEQMENEDHMSKLAMNERGRMNKDEDLFEKQCKEIDEKAERLQADIARVLHKVEASRSAIGEDRNSLGEWKSALKRGEDDIETIEKFSKEDTAKVEVLDEKRRRLKLDYDKKQSALSQLCGDLLSEERTAERISKLVTEALQERRRTIDTWAGAVENLRQRDRDIKQMKEDLEMQREYVKERSDHLKEKQDFLAAQHNNNAEAGRELTGLRVHLAQERMKLADLQTLVKNTDSELLCIKRELMSTATQLSNCRGDNKRLGKEKASKEDTLDNLRQQMEHYKMKLAEVKDGSKTAAQRTKQLEDMLSSEEKYMKQVIAENEKIQHCIFRAQQQLAALKEEENMAKMMIKGYKVSVCQMGLKQTKLEKDLLGQKEILYKVSYSLEKVLGRLGRMEGTKVDLVEEERLERRAAQLAPAVREREAAALQLGTQLTRLACEERQLQHSIQEHSQHHFSLKERMKELTASAEGAVRCVQQGRSAARARRAEEGALRLRAAHAERALRRLGDRGLSVEKAALHLRAAVNERAAEAKERKAVLSVQKRTLGEEKGSLVGDLRCEQLQVEQLKAKYEVYLSSLGKDDNGEALSVTYFTIKNAQEKWELQQEGDTLDAQIRKSEMEIAALEATLHVVDTANRNFIRNLAPAQEDDPEILELNALNTEFNRCREQRSQLLTRCGTQSQQVGLLRGDIASLAPQIEDLETIRDGLMTEVSTVHKELREQQEKLKRAMVQCKKAKANARRKLKDRELIGTYETEIEWRAISDANRSAAAQLRALDLPAVEQRARVLGLNLMAIHSGPMVSRKGGSQSDSSSMLSEREPQMLACECSTPSDLSLAGELSLGTSSGIKQRLYAVRANRSPISISSQDSSRDSKRSSLKPHGKQSGSSSLPMSVVMLGLDSEPVREVAEDALSSAGRSKKSSVGKSSPVTRGSKKQSSSK